MRILITGVTGFAGGHLAEALLAQGASEVYGLSRRARWPDTLRHLHGPVTLQACDLCDGAATETALRQLNPQQIYHLAGYANPGRSFVDMDDVWASNLLATRRLYEAVSRWGGRPRILFVGSGLVYGNADTPNQGHDENALLRPMSPYAASKAAADLVSFQSTRDSGLDIVRVRPFNHIGPRQSAQYSVAHFAQQIAAIEAGLQPPLLETRSLSSQRDLTDVRDMVLAYILLMERGRSGEVYNAGVGESYQMQTVLDRLLAQALVPIEVRQQTATSRVDTTALRANVTRLRQEIGWAPRRTLDETLADVLAFWRRQA